MSTQLYQSQVVPLVDNATTPKHASAADEQQQDHLMGPRLKQSLSSIEKQNELKHKLKRTLQKLDDGIDNY